MEVGVEVEVVGVEAEVGVKAEVGVERSRSRSGQQNVEGGK